MPKHFDLTLDLPAGNNAGDATPSAEAVLLRDARERLPVDGHTAGLLIKSVANDGHALAFSVSSRDALATPDIFIEDDRNIGFSAPKFAIDGGRHSATLTVIPLDTLPAGTMLAAMPLTVTVVNGDHATELHVIVPPASASPATVPVPAVPFAVALLFALIGGLILNLMPCVLPVLSLKILSVVGHGGGTRHLVRQSFLVTAAGIVFSFITLAGVTVALKNFGLALGWGVQFQQPGFLIFLVLLLTFFAANLWELLDIPLPRFLADTLSKSYHPKLAGDFATGAAATLLATPCSAPFLGTAVGFALAGTTLDIFAIFAALGFGMALPYLLVAAFPRVAIMLPKPGAWMVHLRHLLGVALAATAVWLIWVLAAQITVAHAVLFGLLMCGIVILLFLRKRGMRRGLILAGIIEFAVISLLLGYLGSQSFKETPQMDRQWTAYHRNALEADRAERKTVFLDVTADWCLTCKANMHFTLGDGAVAERLFHTDVIAMQADWTNPDPEISDLLHHYGRYGIPFNIVYGPGAPDGILLPELLTPQAVIDALDKAATQP